MPKRALVAQAVSRPEGHGDAIVYVGDAYPVILAFVDAAAVLQKGVHRPDCLLSGRLAVVLHSKNHAVFFLITEYLYMADPVVVFLHGVDDGILHQRLKNQLGRVEIKQALRYHEAHEYLAFIARPLDIEIELHMPYLLADGDEVPALADAHAEKLRELLRDLNGLIRLSGVNQPDDGRKRVVEKVRVDLELQCPNLRFLFLLLFLVIVGDGRFQAVEHVVIALVEDGYLVSGDGISLQRRGEAILVHPPDQGVERLCKAVRNNGAEDEADDHAQHRQPQHQLQRRAEHQREDARGDALDERVSPAVVAQIAEQLRVAGAQIAAAAREGASGYLQHIRDVAGKLLPGSAKGDFAIHHHEEFRAAISLIGGKKVCKFYVFVEDDQPRRLLPAGRGKNHALVGDDFHTVHRARLSPGVEDLEFLIRQRVIVRHGSMAHAGKILDRIGKHAPVPENEHDFIGVFRGKQVGHAALYVALGLEELLV